MNAMSTKGSVAFFVTFCKPVTITLFMIATFYSSHSLKLIYSFHPNSGNWSTTLVNLYADVNFHKKKIAFNYFLSHIDCILLYGRC